MKMYIKPKAEYISFYSEEDVMTLPEHLVGENTSGFVGEDDNDQGWS